ncbi:MAG: hypothetical protein PVJ75_13950, partial [Chloroflexota bacterium]
LAQQLISAAELRGVGSFLSGEKLPMAYGGRVFVGRSSLQRRIEGHYLGDELLGAVAEVERLMSRSEMPAAAETLPEAYAAALGHLNARKAACESALATTLAVGGQSPAEFADAGNFLTRNVVAALKLGNLELVEAEIEWIGGLLGKRNLEPDLLRVYLSAYRQALMDTLDQRGQIIIDWLDGLLSRL